MHSYHGTSATIASTLLGGAVDITLGGGELGRGFYSGQYLHEAKAWAYHVSGDKTANVVEFVTPDADVEALDLLLMDASAAGLERLRIRQQEATKTEILGADMVWAPIVGSERVTGDQYKWESQEAGNLLNDSTKTIKSVI